ncbi:MAG: DedA family protein [Gammaproteobacteria bacterium]|nr:DedA family protein [Gammaproteobacteria bacterium]
MKLFSRLYDWTLRWSGHPKASWFLAGLGFAESSFFPVPPDVLLAPMVLARPERGWWLAALTTVASVIGGLFGYLIGLFLYQEVALPLIELYHAQARFDQVKTWFDDYGFWIVFLAGFSPIPYKLFTISAGVVSLAVVPFTLASLVGRGARFFLVAGLVIWGGERLATFLRRWVDLIGWILVAIIVVLFFFLRG